MEPLPLNRAFTLIEPGPVTLVTTRDGDRDNVMTITWTMVLDFDARFAIATGPWNHSWAALTARRDCVLAIPGAGLLDAAVGIGTCSGAGTDKFAKFGLTRVPARHVGAPLIAECLGNIECRVAEIVAAHGIVVLEGVAAWTAAQADGRLLHARGDGTFTADGERFDRRAQMQGKLPEGI